MLPAACERDLASRLELVFQRDRCHVQIVDLAVAVVIGGATLNLVNAMVSTPEPFGKYKKGNANYVSASTRIEPIMCCLRILL